jgi:hypothetical protein
MGLIAIYAVVWKYPNAPDDVMPEQPAVTMPAPESAPTTSVVPQQPGGAQ